MGALAFLFERLGPARASAVGRAFIDLLTAQSNGHLPEVTAEACIGIGRRPSAS